MPSLRPPEWRTALVTGASSGIGRSFATALAGRGLDLVVVARRRDRLEELAAELSGPGGGGAAVEVLVADLATEEGRVAVEQRLTDPGRPVDILVNAAGFGSAGRFVDLDPAGEQGQVEVNVTALLRLTRAALAPMVGRDRGAVLNISSLAGHQGIPGWATYSATKAFVTTFSRSVAAELQGTGVHVMVVMPGFTRTEFHTNDEITPELVPGPAWMMPDQVAALALRDLERGRSESTPGARFKALAAASWMSPWPLTRAVLRRATRRAWSP